MADYDSSRAYSTPRSRADTFAIDEGLRSYMMRVYNYMGIGLVLTGVVAYAFYTMAVTDNPAEAVARLPNHLMLTALGKAIYGSWLRWVIALAPLAVVFIFAARINQMSSATAQSVFWAFAALMGLSLSSIFVVYTGHLDHADLLHHRGDVRRCEPLWLHDEARSDRPGLVPDDGPDRHRHRQRGEHVPAARRAAIRRSRCSAC